MTTNELAPGFYDAAPVVEDRTAAWQYLRSPGEVYKAGDMWFITSHAAVREAQKHPELFSSARAFDAISGVVQLIPIAIDPPDHTRYRRILDPMLSPKMIDRIEDDLRGRVRGLIDEFASKGECDVVADLALKFPTEAILTLFGLPREDLTQFLVWIEGIIQGPIVESLAEPTPGQIENAMALFGYLQEQLSRKRDNPADDMLSDILALSGDDAWSEPEVLGLCFLFILAGLDTVTGAIGFCLHTLVNDTALRQRLIDDPSLIAPFIEEVLRLEGPVPVVPRVTTADVEVAGVTIPANCHVMLVLATANREARENGVDVIDLEHRTAHVGFGGGIHRCLGSHLARRELRLTIEEFHARIRDYRIPADRQPVVAWPAGTLHFSSLPLEFTPSA